MNIKKTLTILSLASLSALFSFYFVTRQEAETELIAQVSSKLTQSQQTDNIAVSKAPLTQELYIKKTNFHIPEVTFESYKSVYGPLPRSLRGTRIPAAFELDSEGHLVITSTIKSVIEYFLSATGEETIETLVARIEEFMTQQLKGPARLEALDVLSQYIGYKVALVELERNLAENLKLSGQSADYLTLFQHRRETRMNNLSPEVYDAFFENEDKEDSYTAGLLEVRRNKELSAEEKAAQSLALEQVLPPKEQAVKQAERARENLNKDIQIARDNGASEEQIFQMRSEVYDYETAERFAAADLKKVEWNSRYEQYRLQRQSILNNHGLSDGDKASEIYTVQTQFFNQTEQRRLSTLDQMADERERL